MKCSVVRFPNWGCLCLPPPFSCFFVLVLDDGDAARCCLGTKRCQKGFGTRDCSTNSAPAPAAAKTGSSVPTPNQIPSHFPRSSEGKVCLCFSTYVHPQTHTTQREKGGGQHHDLAVSGWCLAVVLDSVRGLDLASAEPSLC